MAGDPALASLWPRLFVAGLILAFAGWTIRRRRMPGAGWLFSVPVALLVRDTASIFLPYESLYIAADCYIAFAYLGWLDAYLKRTFLRAILVAVTVPLLALRVVTGGAEAPLLVKMVSDVLLPAGAYTLLIVGFIEIRELYVPGAAPVRRARSDVLAFLAPTYLLPMLQGYTSEIVLSIILPLAYLAHIRVLFEYQREADLAMREAIDFRDTNINTLFEFMARVRHAILEHQPEESVLNYAISTLVHSTRSDAGAILLLDEDGRTLRARAVEGFFPPPYEISEATKKKIGAVEKYFRGRPIDVDETVLGDVVRTHQGVFIPDPRRDERLAPIVDDEVCFMSSFIAVPILMERGIYGVAAVVRRQNPLQFSRADYDHAIVLGEYASVTLANLLNYMEVLEKEQLESELRMAADIQKHMLPERLPEHPKLDIAAYSKAARNVGGDYYDVVNSGGDIGVLVCDVAGKGVPAALIMVMIRTIFRMSQTDTADPGLVTSWINRGVSGNVDIGRFATLTYVSYSGHDRRLLYANAGHLPGLLVHCDGHDPEWLPAQDIPIGIEAGRAYETLERSLDPGDTLVLYTDGLAEARNPHGEEFGEARIANTVIEAREESAQEILETVRTEVDFFVQDQTQHDDQTLVVMKVRGGCQ
jgi:sigma-B regulation protein RsbU (phosphoserine phosphatase)